MTVVNRSTLRPAPNTGGWPPSARLQCGNHPARDQRGFTLIEVIVAFMMLALALTLLLGTLSGAAKQVRHAEDAGRAALHAQTLLDQVGIGEPLRAGRSDGELDDGRYRWSLEVAPWRDPGRADVLPTAGAPQLMELVLDIEWGEPGSTAARQRLQSRALRLTMPEALQ